MAPRIPVFDLYGAPSRDQVPGFLHAERIRVRARLHGWSISTHRHRDLYQAFLIADGGGTIEAEGRRETFGAPHFLWIPAGVVHGFRFEPDTDGHVVTVAADFLDEALGRSVARDLAPLRDRFVSAIPAEAEDLARTFAAIEAECAADRPAARLAAAAAFDHILVGLARIGAPPDPPGLEERNLAVYRRFLARLEVRLRDHETVADHAEALGVTPDRLADICLRVAGRGPLALIHDRLLLEARRALVYTGMTVAEIGYDLGFRDPAYFSRFFAARVGRPPGAYRRDPAGTAAATTTSAPYAARERDVAPA